MPDATVGDRADVFAVPDLSAFCRLDELGLFVTGQRLEPDRAVLACRVLEPRQWCHRCGCGGSPRDTVTRRLAHEPFGWRPAILLVTVRRYRCADCGNVWRQDTSRAAEPRAKLSRRGLRWALEAIVVQHLTVQTARLDAVFAVDAHVQVEATWGVCQRMITAYRQTDRVTGRQLMAKLIETVSHGVPAALTEITTLGRTHKKRSADVLAYFDPPGTSNGPTEAINGRLEHLRGSALGFRNLTNYIARSLLETGGFRPGQHPRM